MTPTEMVAHRVAQIRRTRGWTAEQLAARCREIGAEYFTAAKINNIETRAKRITIDELLILAFALAVEPLQLVIPLGEVDSVELVPGVAVHPYTARRWFTGTAQAEKWSHRPDVVPGLDMELYTEGTRLYRYFWNEYEYMINAVAGCRNTADRLLTEEGPESAQYKAQETNYHSALHSLARILGQLQAVGFRLPPVERRYLDDMRAFGFAAPADVPVLEEVNDAGR